MSMATARLCAARISWEHCGDLCSLHRDPEVMKTLSADGNVTTDGKTREGLQRQIEHWKQHDFGLWAFYDKATGRFVGRGGLQAYEIDGVRETGLAYAVMSDLWNRGYATEMAAACLRYGFEQLCLETIASWTLPINRASQRVMEKLGFRYERDIRFAGLPHRLYRVSKSEWPAIKEEQT